MEAALDRYDMCRSIYDARNDLSHVRLFVLTDGVVTVDRIENEETSTEVATTTHPTTGAESSETALVLSAQDGVVLKIGDRIETGLPGRIVFDQVPETLRDRPTLVTTLQSQRAGPQSLELSYLTGGLSWKADYVAELNADDSSIDLNGWVTLVNQSGTSYSNAKLQLVAGDVNRVRDEMRGRLEERKVMTMAAPAPAPMAQESLFEYHLYTLGRPTTIANQQTKQVAMLSATAVPVTKELLVRGADYYYRSSAGDIGQKLKAGVYVEFANREAARLGMPLPELTVFGMMLGSGKEIWHFMRAFKSGKD